MAKLAAERLDKGATAIALQKQILELDPQARPASSTRWRSRPSARRTSPTVAEVLERRIDAAADDAGAPRLAPEARRGLRRAPQGSGRRRAHLAARARALAGPRQGAPRAARVATSPPTTGTGSRSCTPPRATGRASSTSSRGAADKATEPAGQARHLVPRRAHLRGAAPRPRARDALLRARALRLPARRPRRRRARPHLREGGEVVAPARALRGPPRRERRRRSRRSPSSASSPA